MPNNASPGPNMALGRTIVAPEIPAGPPVRRVRVRGCKETATRISTDAGDEHEAGDAGRGRALALPSRRPHVHGLECHATPLDIGRNGVHHGVGSGDGGRDRGLVAHVSALDHDPVHGGRSASRRGGMADRDADSQSVPGEAPHEPPTQEPRPPNTTTRSSFAPACRAKTHPSTLASGQDFVAQLTERKRHGHVCVPRKRAVLHHSLSRPSSFLAPIRHRSTRLSQAIHRSVLLEGQPLTCSMIAAAGAPFTIYPRLSR